MNDTVGAVLRRAAAMLSQAGIEGAAHEARLLLAHALGTTQAALVDRQRSVDAAGLEPLLARRMAREPMAYVLGRQGFWTIDLAVSPATLIPRADSETLIEAALAEFPDRARVRRVLDLGTGSGCLLLAALAEFGSALGVGVDLSAAAAAAARANARACGLGGRAHLLVGRWAEALTGGFDLVLCNPPYIETGDIAGLMAEVAGHEPRLALDGGADGLDAYRAVLAGLARRLAPEGRAVLELGAGQGEAVTAIAAAAGLRVTTVRADLGLHPRAMVLQAA